MIGSVRHFPLRGLALVGLGFLLATALVGGGPIGGLLGFLFFLPLLLLKMMFFFFLFGLLLRVVAGRWGGPGGGWDRRSHWHRGPRGGHGRGRPSRPQEDDGSRWWYKGQPMSPRSQPEDGDRGWQRPDPEQRDWEESLRRARQEVEDLDARMGDAGFRPPKPASD